MDEYVLPLGCVLTCSGMLDADPLPGFHVTLQLFWSMPQGNVEFGLAKVSVEVLYVNDSHRSRASLTGAEKSISHRPAFRTRQSIGAQVAWHRWLYSHLSFPQRLTLLDELAAAP
jgi:hypothetical protein